jgi:outer membrane protein assembly factor BamE
MNPSTRATRARRRAAAVAALTIVPTLLACVLVFQGCSTPWISDAMSSVTPYKVEIVQGNVVTREQLAQLKPGMTRDQVRAILGAPLLADVFHADRWDYPFTIRRKGVEAQRRNVVVGFAGNVVKTIEAPELPSEREFVAGISNAKPRAVPKLELTDDERAALPAAKGAAPAASDAAAASGAKRDYPPLEPAR